MRSDIPVAHDVEVRRLGVRDAYELAPTMFGDDRGAFVVPFQQRVFSRLTGHPLHVAQVNHNVSRRGAVRGVHYTAIPPGQAKYVYCVRGALLDVVVDLRIGSPTFGRWDAVRLDADTCHAVYLAEGLGHACMALSDGAALTYLCSTAYDPDADRGIDPFDRALRLPWPAGIEPILSTRDTQAPSLADAVGRDLLPRYADCRSLYTALARDPA